MADLGRIVARRELPGGTVAIDVAANGRVTRYWLVPGSEGAPVVWAPGGERTMLAAPDVTRPDQGPVRSPMAGLVTAVTIATGDAMAFGTPLLVIEAMKMRFEVTAEAVGLATRVTVAVGDRVTVNQVLVEWDAAREADPTP